MGGEYVVEFSDGNHKRTEVIQFESDTDYPTTDLPIDAPMPFSHMYIHLRMNAIF